MSLEYGCFISYVGYDERRAKSFYGLMQKMIEIIDEEFYVDTRLKTGVFRADINGRAGDRYNDEIAEALCRSACMILFYTRPYFHSSYCVREYKAMINLEKKRQKFLNLPKYECFRQRYFSNLEKSKHRGLIIPIIYRGGEKLPKEIKDKLHYIDLCCINNDISNEEEEKIKEIGQYITKCYSLFQDLFQEVSQEDEDNRIDCNGYSLPKENTIKRWWNNVKQEVPIAYRFPGRS